MPLLLDRIKQSMVSCREASIFFRKRAALEDEFGRGLYKLARSTSEVYAMNDGKAGSFVSAWSATMKIHEILGESRVRFAQRLAEMSDELAGLAKEVERNRKTAKDLGSRYERALQDAEGAMEKAKARVTTVTEELERVLVAKEGETMRDAGLRGADGRVIGTAVAGKGALGKAVAKGGALLKGKPASVSRLVLSRVLIVCSCKNRKRTFVRVCPWPRTRTVRPCSRRKRSGRNTSTFSSPGSFE